MPDLNLGKIYDGEVGPEACHYDADSLTTHGVIFGMTGSGKTGLSITLLEELVLAGVPLILIDPKGDLPNLGLVFPELQADAFEPWISEQEAARQQLTVKECAQKTAELWRRGLEDWQVDTARLKTLRSRLALTIYTPGAEAAVPVNVLGSFACPDAAVLEDATARKDLLTGTVSSLLSLLEIDADPVRDPRHIVLCQILDCAWEAGEDLTLESLITRLVDPPFQKVGVFPLDTFFKPDDRMKLAMAFNGVLASPTFESWMKGEDIDVQRLTSREGDRVPVSLFYLAHLSETERRFFVSLLLEKVVAWSRTLSGSAGLRALLYFDEVAGYLPPHPANPPTKKPILTLMKQARAVGVGTVLATQNPVDVDYKAISNAGTWWIGRLQTAQDRDRVLDGLLSASGGVDRDTLHNYFGQLKPRVFLLKEAGEDTPRLYHTRWAMSYLRGPVTRQELKLFNFEAPSQQAAAPAASEPTPELPGSETPPPIPEGVDVAYLCPETVFSARLDGFFEEYAEPRRSDGKIYYRPSVYAELQLRFDQKQGGFTLDEHHHRVFFPIDRGMGSHSVRLPLDQHDFSSKPEPDAVFAPLPAALDESDEFKQARKELVDGLYRNVTASQWIHAGLKLYGKDGETRDQFEERCQQAVQENIDAALAKLQDKYDKKVQRIEDQIIKKRQRLEQLEATASGRRTEQLFQAGEMILGFFTKRRRSVSSALTKHRMASEAKMRAEHAGQELVDLENKLEELKLELLNENEQIEEKERAQLDQIEQRSIRLDKKDIRVVRFGILWVPISRRV